MSWVLKSGKNVCFGSSRAAVMALEHVRLYPPKLTSLVAVLESLLS